ncbi:hypothetical protein LACDD01_02139 [Lactococcus sp. DD01]|nr:hypothetical protein LACDD01_02139 [Lactococcus sp. DD01]
MNQGGTTLLCLPDKNRESGEKKSRDVFLVPLFLINFKNLKNK